MPIDYSKEQIRKRNKDEERLFRDFGRAFKQGRYHFRMLKTIEAAIEAREADMRQRGMIVPLPQVAAAQAGPDMPEPAT